MSSRAPESAPRPAEQEADALVRRDGGNGAQLTDPGGMRAAVSNAMVGLKKEFYGKGPERARTYFNDNYVFCVMEGGLTRNEHTLIERGHHDMVRTYRLAFQTAMADTVTTSVEKVTCRRVLTYQSQLLFDPDTAIEMFVLDGPPGQG